jgi:hypothetical protein
MAAQTAIKSLIWAKARNLVVYVAHDLKGRGYFKN